MEKVNADEQAKKPRTDDVKLTEYVDFSGLLLSEPVLSGLKEAGFDRPSPIQLKAIPLGRCGLDLVVQAKSGTGKTCVFSVVALENIEIDSPSTQVLVLAPTREIAVQIWEVINTLGKALPDLRCYTFIGGMPVSDDKIKLKRCHIAVGTPGRVKQLITEQVLNTESIRLFILDEADKLMEDGFQETINWIFSSLPENKQMLALSATYPEILAKHLTAYMRNPTFVRLNVTDPALLGIRQYYKEVPFSPLPAKAFEAKCTALMSLLNAVAFQQCLVFSNYQLRAQSLSDLLNSKGWPSTYISGNQEQKHRLTAMAKLKSFKCRILISTDLTSRGIDAENVNLVVNLDIPYDHETYLHRIGRAGRFGTFGAAVTLVSLGKERADLMTIEQKANTKIKSLPDPVPSDLTHSLGYMDLEDCVTTEQLTTETPVSEACLSETNGHMESPDCPGTTTTTMPTTSAPKDLPLATHSSADSPPKPDQSATASIPEMIESLSKDVTSRFSEVEDMLDHALRTSDSSPDKEPDPELPEKLTKDDAIEQTEAVFPTNGQAPQPLEDVENACTTDDTEKLDYCDRLINAKVAPYSIIRPQEQIKLPNMTSSMPWKPPAALSYNQLKSDLKHFRETGKHLVATSSTVNHSRSVGQEEFDKAVDQAEVYLNSLHLDPVQQPHVNKDEAEQYEAQSEATQHWESSVVAAQCSSAASPTLTTQTAPDTESQLVGDQTVVAKPDLSDSVSTKSWERKAKPKALKSKSKPVTGSSHSPTDVHLGLDYIKKLTACLDDHSDELFDETDTETDEMESSEDEPQVDYNKKKAKRHRHNNKTYRNDKTYQDDKTYRDQKWEAVESTEDDLEYNHLPQEGLEDEDFEWSGGQHDSQYEAQSELPYCQPQWTNYGYQSQPSYGYQHPFPHQLWLQCYSLLNSMQATQAAQYSWYCHQQYMYHSQQARYYQTVFSGSNLDKMKEEFQKQKDYIKNAKLYPKK